MWEHLPNQVSTSVITATSYRKKPVRWAHAPPGGSEEVFVVGFTNMHPLCFRDAALHNSTCDEYRSGLHAFIAYGSFVMVSL